MISKLFIFATRTTLAALTCVGLFFSFACNESSKTKLGDSDGVSPSATELSSEIRAKWNHRLRESEKESRQLGSWFSQDLCESLKAGVYISTRALASDFRSNAFVVSSRQASGATDITSLSAGKMKPSKDTWWVGLVNHFSPFASVSLCKTHVIGQNQNPDGSITLDATVHVGGFTSDGLPIEEHLSVAAGFSALKRELQIFEYKSGHRVERQFEPFREVTEARSVAPHLLGIKRFDPGVNVAQSVGLSVVDVNEDGLLDFYLARKGPNLLYIQKKDGTFEDQIDAWGIQNRGDGRSALFMDADGDGDLDLFLANHPRSHELHKPTLFAFRRETGNSFVEISEEAFAIEKRNGPFSQLLAADVDGDERPDLLALRYGQLNETPPNHIVAATNGEKNSLFMNEGSFRFKEAGLERGLRTYSWSFAASFADYDNDGDQDFYVANDWGADSFFVNNGKGFFRDEAESFNLNHRGSSMGVVWGDFNNDQKFDLFVSGMFSSAGSRITSQIDHLAPETVSALKTQARGNMIFLSDQDSGFTASTPDMGHIDTGWAWNPILFDYDLDGDEDLYVANGYYSGKQKREL